MKEAVQKEEENSESISPSDTNYGAGGNGGNANGNNNGEKGKTGVQQPKLEHNKNAVRFLTSIAKKSHAQAALSDTLSVALPRQLANIYGRG